MVGIPQSGSSLLKRLRNKNGLLSALFSKGEHQSKKKSCQSSKKPFRDREAVECAQALAGQEESGIPQR